MEEERFYDPDASYTDHLWLIDKSDGRVEIGVWLDGDYKAIDLDANGVRALRLALQRWERKQ